MQRDLGRAPEADASYSRAIPIQERLARDYPAVAYHQLALASAYDGLARLRREQGRAAEADALEDQAIKARERLSRGANKESAELADSEFRRGLVEWNRRNFAKAAEAYKKAIAVAEKLVRNQPAAMGITGGSVLIRLLRLLCRDQLMPDGKYFEHDRRAGRRVRSTEFVNGLLTDSLSLYLNYSKLECDRFRGSGSAASKNVAACSVK